jgi:hypothetical protein
VLAGLGRGVGRDIALVVLDILLTTLIALFGFILLRVGTALLGSLISGRDLGIDSLMVESASQGVAALHNALRLMAGQSPVIDPVQPAMMSMTLSTYATSIWIWVFFGGVMLIRLAALGAPVLRLVSFLVDVESYPFRAAWLIFALAWSAGVALAAAL